METPGKYILAIFSSPSLGVGKGERDINEFKQKEEFLEGGGGSKNTCSKYIYTPGETEKRTYTAKPRSLTTSTI